MRTVLAALIAACVAFRPAAAEVPAPRILVVDRATLKAASSLDQNGSDMAVQTILRSLMAQYGANMVLDRSIFIGGAGKVDVTAQLYALLHTDITPPGYSSLPASIDPAVVAEPRLGVVDETALAGVQSGASVLDQVLRQVILESGANLLLKRSVVIYGTDGRLDFTSNVTQHLGRPAGNAVHDHPIAFAIPPAIVTIDRSGVLQNSLVGRDLAQQVAIMIDGVKSEYEPRATALRNEKDDLEKKIAANQLSDVHQHVLAFQAEADAFQKLVNARQDAIQQGVYAVRKKIDATLGPLIQDVMREQNANLLIDRSVVVVTATEDFDITAIVTRRLDDRLQSVKLELADMPPAL
jgi:Skp family chaperone for outer membrane proteins